ncbi:MAG: DUF4192 domain-containing protein [Sciscionella sp.]|nr:DUF4192 domain-containing protein [Sciscionella sp.]
MSTPILSPVALTNPAALIAAIPHLLGFHPENSLVLITHVNRRKPRIGIVLRADLPAPSQCHVLATQLMTPVRNAKAIAVSAVVVGGNDNPNDRRLVDAIRSVFAERGIATAHRLWVPHIGRDAPWRCYDDDACRGRLPDPRGTEFAAISVAAGVVTRGSRADLIASLDHDDGIDVAKRAELITMIAEDAELPNTPGAIVAAREKLAVVEKTITAMRTESLKLDNDLVVRLAVALREHRVRDACMDLDVEMTPAAEQLWLALTRMVPEPERAEPACLFAIACYLRGDGAMASIAIECARTADPGHELAAMLGEVLYRAVSPARLREITRRAGRIARLALAGAR